MKRMAGSCLLLLGLLFLPAAWRLLILVPPQESASTPLTPPAPPATPFERSLRDGWKLRSRALLAEIREREALESWDPATAGLSETALRSESLARDRSGDLRRAREAARQAESLARTPIDARRAAALVMLIERDLGQHEAEQAQARRLKALAER